MEDFVHLHVHTQYSILDGQSKIPHLVDKAIKDYEIKFTRTGESAERVPEDGPAPTDLDEVRDIDYRRVDEQ